MSAHSFLRAPDLDADVYIFHRPMVAQPGMQRVIDDLTRKGRLLIADYDDLIFGDAEAANQSSQFRNGLLSEDQAERLFRENLNSLFAFDRVTVSTGPLRDEVLAHHPSAKVSVIPNFIPRSLLRSQKTDELWARARPTNRIGYFCGTLSHNEDFRSVAPVILDILRSDPKTSLALIGPLDVPTELSGLPNVAHYKAVGYAHLPSLMAHFSTVIAPLEISRFNICKSRVKFLESSLAGCRLVATPIPDIVSASAGHAVLAQTDVEWRMALSDHSEPGSLRDRAFTCFERLEAIIPDFFPLMALQ